METNIDFRYRNYIIILSVSLDTDLGPLGRDPKKQISVCPARVFFRNKVQLPVAHLLPYDVVVHGELGEVGDEPGHVAHEEHHHDADQHHAEVHLVVVTRVVAVRAAVGEPGQKS